MGLWEQVRWDDCSRGDETLRRGDTSRFWLLTRRGDDYSPLDLFSRAV